MKYEQFIENLLALLPQWHYVIAKELQQMLKDKMSLESYYCLQTLRKSGPMSMSELARRLRISRQQATQTVERLYDRGFIQRLHSNTDRRSVTIEITAAANDYIETICYQDTRLLDGMLERIGEENMDELAGAVETLLRILPMLGK